MNSKKKICILLMTGMLVLAACGSNNVVNDDTANESTATESLNDENAVTIQEMEPLSFEGVEPAESDLYVLPIEGMNDEFIRGVDISSYLSEIESGVEYKDFEGNVLDEVGFFKLLAESGVNCVRIRVWNDPYDKEGNSYGGGHNDLETAVSIGQFASQAGLQVLIDFHYSDFWADPSKQKSPKEWAHYTLADKEQATYDFTADSVTKLLDAGVNVTMVQIGNEINNGMSGEKEWERISALLRKGSEAIRAVAAEKGKEIRIAVHFANPESGSLPDYAETLKNENLDYDIFAVSYYPFWHGTRENLTEQMRLIADNYDKEVMVAETSYAYTNEDGDGQGNSISDETVGITLDYDFSVQGQANEVRDVMQAVKNVGDAGIGIFYWEPAWLPVQVYHAEAENAEEILKENQDIWEKHGSGWASSFAGSYDAKDAGVYFGGSSWDNQAMFDFEGNPLESLKIYRYVFGGTTAQPSIMKVDNLTFESGIGQEIQMPETAPARLNSNEIKEISVTWDEKAVAKAQEEGPGFYEIPGVAENDGMEYSLICNLEIKKLNYIKNPGLEGGDMSMWNIEGKGVGREADNNKKSGEYSLKFWSKDPVEYTVWQEITGLSAGTYELGTNLQGGDAGSNAVFELYIEVNGEESVAPSKVTSWLKWETPVITDINIPEGANVKVGVRVSASAGAWGAWDDFYLYEIE